MEQITLGRDFLPELDRHKTKDAVVSAFEKYRIFKYLEFEEREANITQTLSHVPRSETNVTSDQTGNIATYNVDAQASRKAYCERIERAVKRLPRMERILIEERYMCEDAQYMTDSEVYEYRFAEKIGRPISVVTYSNIRWRAFYKLALNLNIAVVVERDE